MRLQIKDLKKGDEFYENGQGRSIKCVALKDARRVRKVKENGWEFQVEYTVSGESGRLFVAIDAGHYGPKLSKEPTYTKIIE